MDPKIAFTNMLCGGVIMDVMNVEQARIAEDAGATAVMALERVPAIIIRDGGIARASDPSMIKKIQEAVSIPVMAKCRIGHLSEAKILESDKISSLYKSWFEKHFDSSKLLFNDKIFLSFKANTFQPVIRHNPRKTIIIYTEINPYLQKSSQTPYLFCCQTKNKS
jgi:hypothetical protein